MAVESWFDDWLARHLKLHQRADWPDPVDEAAFYDGWRSRFVRHGVREADADEASLRLLDDPPEWLSGHLPALEKLCRAVHAEQQQSGPGAPPASREAAALASAECPDCGGKTGFAHRYRRKSAGAVDAGGRPLPDPVTFYCRCPLGRFVERSHREGDEGAREVRRRVPDLADHPWLWGEAYRSPPGVPDPGPRRRADDLAAWQALDDGAREWWRCRARERYRDLAHRAGFVEAVAVTWAACPDLVLEPPAPVPDRGPRRRGYPWATGRPEPNVADPAPAATAPPEAGPEPRDDGPAF